MTHSAEKVHDTKLDDEKRRTYWMTTNGNIIEWCNNTHQEAPRTDKPTCAWVSDLGDDQSHYLFLLVLGRITNDNVQIYFSEK